jgi:hypothetical protein
MRVAQPTRATPTPVPLPGNLTYAAAIDGVLEISLVGLADLTFWQDKLRPAGLFPTVRDGRAECLLSATNATFHGIRFRELSFSAFVTNDASTDSRDAAYMAYAFNSLRLFAWIERTLFSTPYYYGQLDVTLGDSARVVAHASNQLILRAELNGLDAASGRKPIEAEMDDWFGPIYLPSLQPGGPLGEKLFYAHLAGETKTYPFDPKRDRFQLTPLSSHTALRDFRDSGFEPREWLVRPSAFHAKSKTVRRK